MTIEYSSNNSGGGWWLSDENWEALEKAGWIVEWYATKEDPTGIGYEDGRWLGALATVAKREGLSYDEAIEEWENVTGCNASDEGCSCCGPPHSFHESDE